MGGMDTDERSSAARRHWTTGLAVAVTLTLTGAVAVMLLQGLPVRLLYDRWVLHTSPFALSAVWIARVLLRRRTDRWLGRLLALLAVLITSQVVAIAVSDAQLLAAGVDPTSTEAFVPAELPWSAAAAFWYSSWVWLTWTALGFPILLLRFPDGRPPHPRWSVVVPIVGLGWVALVAGIGIPMWPTSTRPVDPTAPPLATAFTTRLFLFGMILVLVGMLGAIASVVTRWRVAEGEQRRQIRVVGLSLSLLLLSVITLWPWPRLWAAAQMLAGILALAAYFVAILRYRLHDLDVVISRALVGAVLALAVAVIYLLVVVGVGSLVGRTAEHPMLPLVAVGLVAVLIAPMHRHVRRLVDRMLYSRDADASEVLSRLADELREAGSVDTVARHVADLLVRGTGAVGADITMRTEGGERELAATGRRVTDHPVLREPVRHDGEVLGDVALYARSSSDLAPDAPRLLQDVAGTLGAVLRNAVLTAALQDQVEALRSSRQRLVTAQDEARRALERDLHDGAQARLVALRLKVGLAATQAAALTGRSDADPLRTTIERLAEDVDAAIRSLRDLGRGLHPPLLESEGIAAAIRAGSRGLPLDVEIEVERVGRFALAVEAAVYFSCLEGIKNAATHAAAGRVRITLSSSDGILRFVVEDDGVGFDPSLVTPGHGLSNLHDRLAGLGGRITVDAAPGRGTRLVGEVRVSAVDLGQVEQHRADTAVDVPIVGRQIELGQDARDVLLDGTSGEVEGRRDRTVRAPLRDEPEDLRLP